MQPFSPPGQTASAHIPPLFHKKGIVILCKPIQFRLYPLLPKPAVGLNGCSEQVPVHTVPLHKRWAYTNFERDDRFYDLFGYIGLRIPF